MKIGRNVRRRSRAPVQAARNVLLNMPLLRLRSSEGKLTPSRDIAPVRRSFRRHRSCTFLRKWHVWCLQVFVIFLRSFCADAGLLNRSFRLRLPSMREMGGAPRNPAPRSHFLVWIVKPSGRHCTEGHLTSRVFTEDRKISSECRPPLGALPPSPTSGPSVSDISTTYIS